MSGAKIELMRQTLDLLVNRTGLTSKDRLGIVEFNHEVNVALDLSSSHPAPPPAWTCGLRGFV